MTITAIYVLTPTTFATPPNTAIYQLVQSASNTYSVEQLQLQANTPFTLSPGVYRVATGTTLTPTPGSLVANASTTNGATSAMNADFMKKKIAAGTPGQTIITDTDTKSRWPDPLAVAASATLNVPMDQIQNFLGGAGEEVTI